MQPQKSIVLPVLLSIVVTALIVGSGVYYYTKAITPTTTVTNTPNAAATATITTKATTSPVSSSTATTNPTANWKTYTDSYNGISFKYPNDWIINNPTEGKGVVFATLTSPERKHQNEIAPEPCEGCGPDIMLMYDKTIEEELSNLYNKFGAKTVSELIDKDTTKKKLGTTTLGGVSALEVQEGGLGVYYTIWTDRTKDIFHVTFNFHEMASQLTSTEKTILSTITFTK